MIALIVACLPLTGTSSSLMEVGLGEGRRAVHVFLSFCQETICWKSATAAVIQDVDTRNEWLRQVRDRGCAAAVASAIRARFIFPSLSLILTVVSLWGSHTNHIPRTVISGSLKLEGCSKLGVGGKEGGQTVVTYGLLRNGFVLRRLRESES